MNLAIRSAFDPTGLAGLAASVERAVWAVDKEQPVSDLMTMEQLVHESVAQPRVLMLLLAVFAGLALMLAAVGIYGVMSYWVKQRAHEIGIRMALGAEGHNVLWLVVSQGMTLTLIGVALGLLAAFALTRMMRELLFGVSATDPATFAGIALLLVSVAFIASYMPARRATKVDPLIALRHE
jgi:putative ABC transport system permease protein